MVDTRMETGLSFSVLGPLAASRDGRPLDLGAPKQRALLAVLLANPNKPISVGRIIIAVWGVDASQSYRRSVQTYVSNLRAALDTEITRSGDNYMLAIDPSRIDAVRFEETLDEATTLIATDPGLAASRLRDALAMWRGRPYADVATVEGVQAEINRLEELRLTAVELRIDAELAAGRDRELIAEVEALATEYPLRERFRAQHMIALYRAGRQTEALRVFERTRAYLGEELGIEPSRELQDLELAVLQHDRDLVGGAALTTTQRLAFLATSIEGLNEAWDRNPQVMGESVWKLNETISTAVEAHGGRVIHETGEGLSAVFAQVSASVLAAEEAQREIAAIDWGGLEPLATGVAVDVGEAESHGDRFAGPPVTRARRLAQKAWGGQILLSSAMQEALASASISGLQIRQLGEFDLEGFAKPERVSQLVVEGLSSEFDGLRPRRDGITGDGSVTFSLPGYEIRELIGRGAVGAVYRAYQPSVGREVAIKVIRPTMSNHPRFFSRFETEARVIARLAHPHIVPLIDFWRDAEGAYLVLQYMSGGSLGDALDREALQTERTHRVISQVASALEHAHDRAVAHGDVSPTNILLDESGNAYLADFDIASRLLDGGKQGGVSIPAAFQAPELADTGPTEAADIYAFGKLIGLLVDDAALAPVVERATAADVSQRFSSVRALLEAYEAALDQELVAPGRIAIRNPYKGLRPFDEVDSEDFYGRDALIADLLARVEESRFVAVVGPSGSGKSSVVRAGLLPALAGGAIDGSEYWPTLVLTPGNHPVESLAEGLDKLATRPLDLRDLLSDLGLGGAAEILLQETAAELVLVIDQFEELFSQTEDPEKRKFIDFLVDAVRSESPVRVVVTLRADFYQHLLDEADINELATDGQVTVLAPTREELIEMITCPAESVGLGWAPGLPERIAAEIVGQPGGLPLLQYALTEIVEARYGDVLTEWDYEEAGGVAGALIRRAEHVYSSLPRQQQPLVREVFLRLVQVDERGEDTRRRVRRSELESLGVSRGDLEVVLVPFIAERLLLGDRDRVTRAPTVEVAHEALLGSWPRLARWIDHERDALLLARRFRAGREEWVKAKEDDDYLLTGARLAPFADWARTMRLSAEERDYLERSIRADEQRQDQMRKRRRVLATILGAAATVAVVLSIWALIERDRASQQALRADQASNLARSRELAASAISVLDDDPRLSKLLAVAAADVAEPGRETLLALHEAFAADLITDTYRWTRSESPVGIWTDIHPDGNLLVASGSGPADAIGNLARNLEVVDLTTDKVLWKVEVEDGLATGPAFFTPSGEQVVAGVFAEHPAVADSSAGLYIMDTDTGTQASPVDLGKCGGIVIDVSGKAALVITVADTPERCLLETDVEHQLELVDLETGDRSLILSSRIGATVINDAGLNAVISDDGRFVAYGRLSDDQEDISVLQLSTGEIVQTFEAPGDARPQVFDMSPDGSLIAFGGFPMRIGVIETGETITEIVRGAPGHATAKFSWDGSLLFVTGPEAELQVWEVATGRQLDSAPSAGSGPISTSRSGPALVADPESQSAVVINPEMRGEVLTVPLEDCFIASGGLEATENRIVAYQSCPERKLLTTVANAKTGEIIYSVDGAHGQSYAVSPDGSLLVRQEALSDEVIRELAVRDMRTGALLTNLEGLCTWDAKSTAEAGHRQPGCVAFPNTPFPFMVWAVEWSPDGRIIAATNDPGSYGGLVAWDASSGTLLSAVDFGSGNSISDLIFAPDSSEIIISVLDRAGPTSLQRVDVESWEVTEKVEVTLTGTESSRIGLLGWGPDGRLIGVSGWRGLGAALVWFDGDTFEVSQRRGDIHDGSPRDGSLDQTGQIIATASSDGGVRVWDAISGNLLHEIRLGEVSINAVDFINQHHLLVGTNDGNALVMTTDPAELLTVVSNSLTRGFNPAECERYNFGDNCPTLEDMRRR